MTLADLDNLLKLLAGTSVRELTLKRHGTITRIRRMPSGLNASCHERSAEPIEKALPTADDRRIPEPTLSKETLLLLSKRMREVGLTEIEVSRSPISLRLARPTYIPRTGARRSESHTAKVTPPTVRTPVKARVIGKHWTRYPLDDGPLLEIGRTVEAGQIVAWVKAGKILLPARAQRAGKVSEIMPEGETVGFESPLVVLESPLQEQS